jgi:hypothetical protein
MDDVIKNIYGFEKGSAGALYVKWCLKNRRVMNPRKFLSTRNIPQKNSTLYGLSRASETLIEFHNWRSK